MLPWVHSSSHPKRHLHRFSSFCRATEYGRLNRIRQVPPMCTPITHASLGPPNAQPKRHLHRFIHYCTVHGRVSSGMPGHDLPQKCPLAWGDLDPHLIHDSWAHPSHNPNGISIDSAVLHSSPQSVPILSMARPFPLKIAPSIVY